MSRMTNQDGPVIDMTPQGEFIDPPKPGIGTFLLRLALFGVALAVVAALFWTMILVLPLLILAGVASYFVFRSHIGRVFTIRRF